MRNKTPTPSREFERLVARIEAAVAPLGATVTSPDKLRDRVTGRQREIDVTIRYKIGTTDILIVIECRAHHRGQDVTWIEQLVTRSGSIGADRLIAVSESPFSEPAKMLAKAHNIETRTVSHATEKDIINWYSPINTVNHAIREAKDIECVVYLMCSDGEAHHQGLKAPDCFEPVFRHTLISSPFPPALLFRFLEQQQPEIFASVPLNGTYKKLTFRFRVTPGELLLEGREGNYEVHHVRLSGNFHYELSASKITDGEHRLYSLPTGENYKHSVFPGRIFGKSVSFEHIETPAGETLVSLKLMHEDDENCA